MTARFDQLFWVAYATTQALPANSCALTAAACPPSMLCTGGRGPAPQPQPEEEMNNTQNTDTNKASGCQPTSNVCQRHAYKPWHLCLYLSALSCDSPPHNAMPVTTQRHVVSVHVFMCVYATLCQIKATGKPFTQRTNTQLTMVLRSLSPKYSGPAMAVRGGGGRFSPAAMRCAMVALMRLRICLVVCVGHRV